MNALQAAQKIADQLVKSGYADIYGQPVVKDAWDDNGNPAVIWDAPDWAMNDRYGMFAEVASEMSSMGLDAGQYSEQEEQTWFKCPEGFWAEAHTYSVLVVGVE